MTTGSQPSQDGWRRFVAELRAESEAEQEDWGGIDDLLVGRYVSGEVSPEERQRVEAAIAQYPTVREAVELAHSALAEFGANALESARAQREEGDQTDQTRRAHSPSPLGGEGGGEGFVEPPAPRRVSWTVTGLAMAASLLLGIFLGNSGWLRRPVTGSGELLLASVTVEDRQGRAEGKAARLSQDARGVYQVRPGQSLDVVIKSPRDGFATIVLLGANHREVWPRLGRSEIRTSALERTPYGPIDAPQGFATLLVIATDSPAAETVRSVVQATTAIEDHEALTREIQQAILKAGHRWLALDQVSVEAKQE